MNNSKSSPAFAFLSIIIVISIFLIFTCSKEKENPLVGPVDDESPPSKPATPVLTNIGNGEIPISWSPNPENDIAGYRLYRTENSDILENYQVIFDSTITEYIDKGLDYATKYYYRVAAYDFSTNESPISDPVFGTPYNTLPPGIPQNVFVVARNISFPEFEITWNPNNESDLQGYKIYRGKEFNFPWDESTLLDSTAYSFYSDIYVFMDTVYYYKITAYDKGGLESQPSNPESDVALSPPALLSPINDEFASSLPTFSWDPVDNTVQYKVFLQTSSQGGEIWSITVDNTQTSVQYTGTTALESGRLYYWKVATITKDPIGMNSFSNIQRFRVQ
ncbi:hypothetical protein AMJ80_06600 [bacterium SM23_31]|nr:MAG: hypothetical protein AMJ80_06600 [bacterium SM23_31]